MKPKTYKCTPELVSLIKKLFEFSHSEFNQLLRDVDRVHLQNYYAETNFSDSNIIYGEETRTILNRIRKRYIECLSGMYVPYSSRYKHHKLPSGKPGVIIATQNPNYVYSPYIPLMETAIHDVLAKYNASTKSKNTTHDNK